MSTGASSDPHLPAEKVHKGWIVLVVAGIVAALSLVAYVVVWVVRPASAVANGFLAAMRDGRGADAAKLSTARLAKRLEDPAGADDDEARTLRRLRVVSGSTLGAGQLSAGFTSGCFTTDLSDGKNLHLIVAKEGEAWRVAGVATDVTPKACELEPH